MKVKGSESKRGAALVSVMVVVMALATVAVTLLTRVDATAREERSAKEIEAARLVAEAGLNVAFATMREGGELVLGSAQQQTSFGGGSFWVEEQDLGNGTTRLVANGRAQGRQVESELVVQEVAVSTPIFGVFADERLDMDSNTFVDSYDSSLGSYDSQDVHKQGNDRWAKENGHVGSNHKITIDGNSTVHGDATPGISSVTVVEGNAEVSGSTLPAVDVYILPELVIPSGTKTGNLFVGSSDKTLASGSHFLHKLRLDSNSHLDVIGPATIVVKNMEVNSNAEIIIDATNGPVEFYVEEDFILDSNTMIAATDFNPANVSINLKANNVINPGVEVELDEDLEVSLSSNAQIFGTLFAPHAYIDIDSNFELFGSLIARGLNIDSNSRIHYDENLGVSDDDEEMQYEIIGWRSVPVQMGSN